MFNAYYYALKIILWQIVKLYGGNYALFSKRADLAACIIIGIRYANNNNNYNLQCCMHWRVDLFSEDMILSEERTTEEEKSKIAEGSADYSSCIYMTF